MSSDILNELQQFIHQAKSSRNLNGLKASHLRRAVKLIERYEEEIFRLRQDKSKLERKLGIPRGNMSKPILCIDFDGVIHSYASGWQGETIITDPPVPGAFEWLELLLPHFEVNIYSSRSKYKDGIGAMFAWFVNNGASASLLTQLSFPTQKPAAFLTIDDRCICFDGNFPSILNMLQFKPWNK